MSLRPLAALLLLATACAAPAGKPPPGAPVTSGQPSAAPTPAVIAEEPEARDLLGAPSPLPPAPVLVPGPPAAGFLGGPVADLEALTGPPALTRAEGQGEFRRYDLTEACRAYAVVVNGTVRALETGPSVQGGVAPRFEDCTAR